jgi:hypothetical protein
MALALALAGCGSSGGGGSSSDRKAAASSARQGGADRAAPSAGPSGAVPDVPGSAGTTGSASSGNSGNSGSGSAASPGSTPAPPTYLVRTATLAIRTPHVQDQLAKARQYVTAAGGYSGDETTTVDSRGHTSSTVQLRVPPERYDALLARLAGLGRLLDRKVDVQDVTGQVVDVQSRIKSQRASVGRVRALMDKATDLDDVVSLEGELSTRESALEALEAQQASLAARTDLATVTLRLSEPPAATRAAAPRHHDGFWATVGHAFADGWHGFTLAVRGLLVALAVTLPFLALAALAFTGYRFIRRRAH